MSSIILRHINTHGIPSWDILNATYYQSVCWKSGLINIGISPDLYFTMIWTKLTHWLIHWHWNETSTHLCSQESMRSSNWSLTLLMHQTPWPDPICLQALNADVWMTMFDNWMTDVHFYLIVSALHAFRWCSLCCYYCIACLRPCVLTYWGGGGIISDFVIWVLFINPSRCLSAFCILILYFSKSRKCFRPQ